MNPAALEHRLAHVERELRRRGIAADVQPALEPERAEELLRAATSGELDALGRAMRDGDGLEQARLVALLERRVDGVEAGEEPPTVSPLAGAIEAERARRGIAGVGEVEHAIALVDWMTLDELEVLHRVVSTGQTLADGSMLVAEPAARLVDRLLERARRRREFGIGDGSRWIGPGRRVNGGRCRRGVEGCDCIVAALDLERWAALGLAGVRAVARHRHEEPRVRRASGAARRERARSRRVLEAAAVPAVVAAEWAPVIEGSAVEELEPVEPPAGQTPPARQTAPRRRARLYLALASGPLSDGEAAAIAARVGWPAPSPVMDGLPRRGRA